MTGTTNCGPAIWAISASTFEVEISKSSPSSTKYPISLKKDLYESKSKSLLDKCHSSIFVCKSSLFLSSSSLMGIYFSAIF